MRKQREKNRKKKRVNKTKKKTTTADHKYFYNDENRKNVAPTFKIFDGCI